ncbi:unnamed protein product [Lepeophtheirus salmonis]|uniref:(salmon louse) hypothetical protein n=1 Tax=Lepeophtheirus salmonis TaxID=72036 RepID=A0A7R8CUB5_LEPSM|nr:unnamed protein product [Lepeophtheirus salmonis]CAF2935141.1 unnamed protein product [Lepeophtheirus salmonis]
MLLDQGGNLPTSSEVNLSAFEDNLKRAEKTTVLDTSVESNCGQVGKNEEMTPDSPSGYTLNVASGDNTLNVETKTCECQEEISSSRKTNDNKIIVLSNKPCKPRLEAQPVLTTSLRCHSAGERGRSDLVLFPEKGKTP